MSAGVQGDLDRSRLIYRWDLDKTYLRTEFDTVRDLLRTAIEPASRKRTVPGAGLLLRELSSTRPAGVFILSGSPEQMRKVLEAKLRIDGVQWDSFTLKPSLRNLVRGRFRFLRDQVGYKLGALLTSRASVAPDTHEILFGDDAEADAFIYSLYADLCAGRVEHETLWAVLERTRVHPTEIPSMMRAAARLPKRNPVEKIFIHLDRISEVSVFDDFGGRVCPIYNYFQAACVLVETGALDGDAALRIGTHMVVHHAFSPDALSASFADIARRGHVGPKAARALVESSDDLGTARATWTSPSLYQFVADLSRRMRDLDAPRTVVPSEIDYLELFTRDRARTRAARRRAKLRGTRRS